MADPFRNMNANFVQRLQAFIAASGGRVRPGSGWRDIQEQIQLRRTNGCPDIWDSPASTCRVPTAIPGRSNHNHGLAMDLQYEGDGAEWAAANAHRFGLHFPVRGENWHVEPVDLDSPGHYNPEAGGPVGYNVEFVDGQAQRNPEDELAYRMSTVMDIMMGGTPEPLEPDDPPQMPTVNQAISGIASQQNPVMQENPSLEQAGGFSGGGGGGEIDAFMRAISGQESGGDYNITNRDSGAHGRYQIMPANWGPWAEEAGLGRNAPRTPENQERVARFKIQQYYNQFGNWRDVAVAWYAGPGRVAQVRDSTRSQGGYPSISSYANSVMGRFQRELGR